MSTLKQKVSPVFEQSIYPDLHHILFLRHHQEFFENLFFLRCLIKLQSACAQQKSAEIRWYPITPGIFHLYKSAQNTLFMITMSTI